MRRSPLNDQNQIIYLPQMCHYIQKSGSMITQFGEDQILCLNKDKCWYSHTISEIEYHPFNFRTKFCGEFLTNGKCFRQQGFCPNAHSHNEIRKESPFELDPKLITLYQQYKQPEQADHSQKKQISPQKKKSDSQIYQSSFLYKQQYKVPYSQPQLAELKYKQNTQFGTQNLDQTTQCVPFLDLNVFKTQPCREDHTNHNPKRCPYYHDFKKERRRPLGSYQSEKCPFIDRKGECPNGETCDKSHNRVEEFYHPDKYKAKFCSDYLTKNETCEYNEFCSFAHSEKELSVEMIEKFVPDMDFYIFHFKTVWCPYKEDDHDRVYCVYAHNWQDYRRKPQIFSYSVESCKNWDTKVTITSYKDGCPLDYKCPYSHGWKESEFHPEFFKMKSCYIGENCNKPHCPYYHNEGDKRIALSQWFKYFPKTRTVSFSSNFYNKQLFNVSVINKQTSFSRMVTEFICNSLNQQHPQQSPYLYENNQVVGNQMPPINIQQPKNYDRLMFQNSQHSQPLKFGEQLQPQTIDHSLYYNQLYNQQVQFQKNQALTNPTYRKFSEQVPRNNYQYQLNTSQNSNSVNYQMMLQKQLQNQYLNQMSQEYQMQIAQLSTNQSLHNNMSMNSSNITPMNFFQMTPQKMQRNDDYVQQMEKQISQNSSQRSSPNQTFFNESSSNRKVSSQSDNQLINLLRRHSPQNQIMGSKENQDKIQNIEEKRSLKITPKTNFYENLLSPYYKEQVDEREESSIDSGCSYKYDKKQREKKILDIIDEPDEHKQRTSSQEFQISLEIEMFLKENNLDCLIPNFEQQPDLKIKDLIQLSDIQLEKIVNGELYVQKLKQALQNYI